MAVTVGLGMRFLDLDLPVDPIAEASTQWRADEVNQRLVDAFGR
jgi:hypothetical protein